jgi:hypothetical protein
MVALWVGDPAAGRSANAGNNDVLRLRAQRPTGNTGIDHPSSVRRVKNAVERQRGNADRYVTFGCNIGCCMGTTMAYPETTGR